MKSRVAANSFKILVLALIACFVSIALYGFNARAASAPPAISYKKFGVAFVDVKRNKVSVSFDTGSSAYGEVQLCNSSKKVLQTKTASFYASFSCKIKNNSVYYYRVRPYYENYKGAKTYGPWTKYKAFSTIVLKLKKSTGRSFRVKCPKLPKVVKSVKIMISTSNRSGFKKAASVKPGKTSKRIKKYKGKMFVNKKTYHVKAAPVLKNGVFCENVYIHDFFWRRVYR